MDIEKGELLLGSIGMTVGMSFLLTTPLKLVAMDKLLATGVCIVIGTPISYTIGKRIRQKLDEKMEKTVHQLHHMEVLLEEASDPDRMIGPSTSLFFREISLAKKRRNIELDDDSSLQVLNQFLYLLNSNYYDRLQKKFPSFSREQFVDLILSQTSVYLKEKTPRKFTDREVAEIVERCFFIDPKMKQEIVHEFRAAKVKLGKMVDYVIVPKEVDRTPLADREEKRKNGQEIQLENLQSYQGIIQYYAQNEDMKTLGSNPLLEWDLEFLRRIMTLIDGDFRMQLMRERDRYCPSELVASFISNAMAYALVNQRPNVSPREMLATFKAWNYCSFDLRKEMVDHIFEVEDLKDELYPFYGTRKKENTRSKIISFPTNRVHCSYKK